MPIRSTNAIKLSKIPYM